MTSTSIYADQFVCFQRSKDRQTEKLVSVALPFEGKSAERLKLEHRMIGREGFSHAATIQRKKATILVSADTQRRASKRVEIRNRTPPMNTAQVCVQGKAHRNVAFTDRKLHQQRCFSPCLVLCSLSCYPLILADFSVEAKRQQHPTATSSPAR